MKKDLKILFFNYLNEFLIFIKIFLFCFISNS